MPKYKFECPHCEVHFSRNLKMDDHPSHPCPSCRIPAPRLWMGQGFGFGFTGVQSGSTANTGVSKIDNPTADQVVGSSADKRWEHISERERVKEQVRALSGQRALNRQDGGGGIDYTAGDAALLTQRKAAVKGLDAALLGGASSVNKEFEKAEQKAR